MPNGLVNFSIEEPRPIASTWKGVLLFAPERDLAVVEVLELVSSFGEEAQKIEDLKYLVFTPRYLNEDFLAAKKNERQIVVVIYSIEPSRVLELRGMRMNDAFNSGILSNALGIGDLIILQG